MLWSLKDSGSAPDKKKGRWDEEEVKPDVRNLFIFIFVILYFII